MRVKIDGYLPTVKECKAYIESCGYTFSHRSIIGTYVFYRDIKNAKGEVSFTLRELREAKIYGW